MSPEKVPTLVLIEPSGSRRPVPLLHTPVSIGRRPESDIHLRDSRISRQHAIIRAEDGHYLIEDSRSRHGTFVNGERVEEPRELVAGDRIDFGVPDSYSLLFVTEEEGLEELLERVDTPASTDVVSQQIRKLNLFLEVGRALHTGLALKTSRGCRRRLPRHHRQRARLPASPRRSRPARLPRRPRRWHNNLACTESESTTLPSARWSGREVIVDRVRPLSTVLGREARQSPQPAIICLPLSRAPAVASLDTTDAGKPNILGVLFLDNQKSAQPVVKLDRQILRTLAQEAATLIENARLFSAARAKEQLDRELAIARRIQQRLLPREARHDSSSLPSSSLPRSRRRLLRRH
jgi:pSer/pThr/pTyr-binding forkhead associated (FHA) protein